MGETAAWEGRGRAVVMYTLLLDAVAAQSTALLSEHGISAILLKGQVTASWLYPGEIRTYSDVDLLVDPAQRDRAIEVLGTIGYAHWLAGADQVEYGPNEIELIGPSRTCIDLHHTLLGVAASPTRCWQVLSARAEQMLVGGRVLTVLDPAARTMHLALHVAQNGPIDTKALADLERGLDRLPRELWQEGERIARSIDAIEAFSAGLHVSEPGRRLADELGLAPPRDVGLVLRMTSAPREALQIQKLVTTDSLRSRARLVVRKLWPTSVYMLGQVPTAGAGGCALLAARLRRMVKLPSKFSVALWSWAQARRTVRQQYAQHVTSVTKKGHP
jgi:hypothetical protein